MAKIKSTKTVAYVLTAVAVAATIVAVVIAVRSGASVPVPILAVSWLPILLLWRAVKKTKL